MIIVWRDQMWGKSRNNDTKTATYRNVVDRLVAHLRVSLIRRE